MLYLVFALLAGISNGYAMDADGEAARVDAPGGQTSLAIQPLEVIPAVSSSDVVDESHSLAPTVVAAASQGTVETDAADGMDVQPADRPRGGALVRSRALGPQEMAEFMARRREPDTLTADDALPLHSQASHTSLYPDLMGSEGGSQMTTQASHTDATVVSGSVGDED